MGILTMDFSGGKEYGNNDYIEIGTIRNTAGGMHMEYMDTVITRLSEIESAAVKISEDAVMQKKKIAKEYQEKTRSFDEEADRRTEERLEELKKELQKKADEDLAQMRQETERELENLEKIYERDHKTISRQILQKMIGE